MVFLAGDFKVNNVTGYNIRHKDNQVVYPNHRLAFGCNVSNFYILKYGQFLFFFLTYDNVFSDIFAKLGIFGQKTHKSLA